MASAGALDSLSQYVISLESGLRTLQRQLAVARARVGEAEHHNEQNHEVHNEPHHDVHNEAHNEQPVEQRVEQQVEEQAEEHAEEIMLPNDRDKVPVHQLSPQTSSVFDSPVRQRSPVSDDDDDGGRIGSPVESSRSSVSSAESVGPVELSESGSSSDSSYQVAASDFVADFRAQVRIYGRSLTTNILIFVVVVVVCILFCRQLSWPTGAIGAMIVVTH